MSERPTIPLLDPSAVRHALEQLRQAEPLGDSPLRHLVWVRQQVEAHGPHSSVSSTEMVLSAILTGIISERLAHLRSVVDAPAQGDATRQAALRALRQDFSYGNQELEAWSVLYYRYVQIDLDLQVQDIAHTTGIGARQIHRRQSHGYYRLTEHLSRLETAARSESRRLWLALKLPPPSTPRLLGQDQTLNHLLYLIGSSSPPHTIALVGPGGIGKTTLARTAAENLIDTEFIADLAWICLETQTPYSALLAQLAHSLGYLHLASASQRELEASLRERLESRKTLVVIDNADALEQYDSILPWLDRLIAPGCLLMTARHQPSPGTPLHLIQVQPLPREALVELLYDYTRAQRISRAGLMNESSLNQIIEAVGGNPLAARLVVGQLALLPLERVLEQLPALQTPTGEPLFDSIYLPSWNTLDDTARKTLLCLSLMPEEGARWHDLNAILAIEPGSLDTALRNLVRISLVDTVGPEPRYAIHALTRRFSADQASEPPWDSVYRELLRRVTTYQGGLLRTVQQSGPAGPGHTMALIQHQLELGEQADQLGDLAIQIASAVRQSGQWARWRDVLRTLDPRIPPSPENWNRRAHLLMEMAIAARWLGDVGDALTNFQEAIRLFNNDGDLTGRAQALLEVGQLFETLGRTEPAYEAYQLAASIAQHYRASILLRQALNGLAGLALHNDHASHALELLNQALETLEEGEEPDGQTLSQLGVVYLRLGKLQEAVEIQHQALDTLRDAGDLPRLARAHLRMGTACHAAGLHGEALHHLQTGLDLMRVLGDAFGQARLLSNLGVLYADRARWHEALSTWHEALVLQERLEDQIGMATTLFNIADLEWRLNRHDEAKTHMEGARMLAERVNLVSLMKIIEAHPLYSS